MVSTAAEAVDKGCAADGLHSFEPEGRGDRRRVQGLGISDQTSSTVSGVISSFGEWLLSRLTVPVAPPCRREGRAARCARSGDSGENPSLNGPLKHARRSSLPERALCFRKLDGIALPHAVRVQPTQI